MQSLAVHRVLTRSLQSLAGEDSVVFRCSALTAGLSRNAQGYATRMALLPASPSPSFEGKFHSSSDAPTGKPIPRMEPFNQSRIIRGMRELSLVEKAEHALSDHCLQLEGDEAYRCWEALFQLEKMRDECKIHGKMAFGNESPNDHQALDHLEHIVRQSGGVSTLIDNLLMLAKIAERQKTNADCAGDANTQNTGQTGQSEEATKEEYPASELSLHSKDRETERHEFPEPGCLPKTEEELQMEQSALMPESNFTRLLRRRGKSPSWFTQPPEHETD